VRDLKGSWSSGHEVVVANDGLEGGARALELCPAVALVDVGVLGAASTSEAYAAAVAGGQHSERDRRRG
jgi:hypothetical protein